MSEGRSASDAREVNVRLVRSGIAVVAVVAVVVVLVCGLVQGWSGAWGALLGAALVVAFFGVDVVVYLRPLNIGTPTATVVVALYVVKLVVFGLLVLALATLLSFDHRSFAIAVVVLALAAAAVAVRAFSRMRVPYVQP